MPEQRVSDEDASIEHITARDLEQASKMAADAVREGGLRVSIAAGPGREARGTPGRHHADVPAELLRLRVVSPV